MLQIQGVGKRYGTGDGAVDALTDVSLTVADGEFAALVGPSGCGKTTLLNLIAGLDEHDAGSIVVDGASPTAEQRLNRFGYMPQEDLLFPWRSVIENVSLGLEVQGVDKRDARQRAADLFPQFGLAGFEHRRPHELSGGMRQRASFLRTYLLDRSFLLLDEPFGALDAITRGQLQSWLAETWNRIGGSALLVTHDPARGGCALGPCLCHVTAPGDDHQRARSQSASAPDHSRGGDRGRASVDRLLEA